MEYFKPCSLLNFISNSFSEIFTAFMAYKLDHISIISLVFITLISFYLILPFYKKHKHFLFAFNVILYFYKIAIVLINIRSALSFLSLSIKSTYTQTSPGNLSFFSSLLILLIYISAVLIISNGIGKMFSRKTCFNIRVISAIFGIYFYSFLCTVIPIYFLTVLIFLFFF